MASRTKLIAANWKMNRAPADRKAYKPRPGVDIVVFPASIDLATCVKDGLTVGAQFAHPENRGAHTGDISMAMVKEIGCTFILCGHSERRQNHGETDAFIAVQVIAAQKSGLHPILCVGETAEERRTGREKVVVARQLNAVFEHPDFPATSEPRTRAQGAIGAGRVEGCIAYEPVWAIGTGETATPEDAQEMHEFIRQLLTAHNSSLTDLRILYGGSMKPENAQALLQQPDVDGGLVGGASLDPEQFAAIVSAVTAAT